MKMEDRMGSKSDFLFAWPSFLGGMASVLDLGATLRCYNISPSEWEADRRAIQADWLTVGDDLLQAMNHFYGEIREQKRETPSAAK